MESNETEFYQRQNLKDRSLIFPDKDAVTL